MGAVWRVVLRWLTSRKEEVSTNDKSSWGQIRALNDDRGKEWQGLLPGDDGRKDLDQTLRKELLKYGELAQVTYDAFNSDRDHPKYGHPYWENPDVLQKETLVNTLRTTGAEEYTIVKYIHAKSFMYNPTFVGGFITRALGTYKKPEKRMALNMKYDLQLPKEELHGPEDVLTPQEIDAKPVWMGYIAWSKIEADEGGGGVDVVVAFRGTIVLQEWLIDANAYQLEDGKDTYVTLKKTDHNEDLDVQLHPGFRDMYTEAPSGHASPQMFIREELKRLVNLMDERKTPVKSITFIGHSLGGAMAVVAASDIGMMRHKKGDHLEGMDSTNKYCHDLWKDISMVAFTFAAPRVGNFEFRQQLDILKVRVLNTVNVRDVVPAVPVSGVGFTLGTTVKTLAAYFTRLHAKHLKGAERQRIARPHGRRRWFNWLRTWRAVHRYSNAGVRLLLDSDKLKALRPLGLSKADMCARHNLEVHLQMLSTQHIQKKAREAVWRDIALINKHGDGLRKDICEALSIPSAWWSPSKHRGLELRSAPSPQGTYWRRPRQVEATSSSKTASSRQNSTYTNKADSTDSDKKLVTPPSNGQTNHDTEADKASVSVVT